MPPHEAVDSCLARWMENTSWIVSPSLSTGKAAVEGIIRCVLSTLLLEIVHVDLFHGFGGDAVQQREEHRP